jgi:hypothetical protein
MAERTAILIDGTGVPVGTEANPLVIVASGMSMVASLVDLTDVAVASPTTGDYIGYDPATGKYINKPVTGTGTGDVTGPNSSTDRSIVVFDDITGKLITDTSIIIGDDGTVDVQGNKIVNLQTPVESHEPATKFYVDQFVQGLSWQDPVISIEIASPTPAYDRARYIVDEGAVGDFIGHSDEIAVWYDDEGRWEFLTPGDGWACYNEELGEVMVYNSPDSVWRNIGSGGISEAPIDGIPYLRMNAGWVKTASGSIIPLDPNQHCLTAWHDNEGTYLRNAGYGAYVPDGLFVKTPHSARSGEYKCKVYGDLNLSTYAGILDLNGHVYSANSTPSPTNIGFVTNLFKNQNAALFGGGLLICGGGSDGDLGDGSEDPRVVIAVKPRGSSTVMTVLKVYKDGLIRLPYGVFPSKINIPVGQTYNIDGYPHTHSQYLPLSGGTLSGILNAGNNRIINVGEPVAGSDAVTVDYVGGLIGGVVWQQPIESIVTSPPESPSDGERYLVAHSGTSGVFVGHEDEIATYVVDHWGYEVPDAGWCLANKDDNYAYAYNGTLWVQMPGAVSHSALQNLAVDDHTQYVHISNNREITAIHTFTNGFAISVSDTIDNLNASYLDGVAKEGFALTAHTHGFATLDDFLVASPASGDTLAFDYDLGKFVNTPASGTIVIDPAHQFADDTERDAYFVAYPDELVDGMFIAVGTGFQQYDAVTPEWNDRTAIVRGPAGTDGRDGIDGADGADGAPGATGPAGEQGIQGVEGPQGVPGSPGTSINMQGSVPASEDLPAVGDLNDGWYCEDSGDCYVWSADSVWVNVGPIVGPQGLQGVQGIQGATGPTGATGAAGPAGPAGQIGPVGPRGPPGLGGASWQLPVKSIEPEPPGIYDWEDRFIVASAPTAGSEFEGHGNAIATWLSSSAWYFDDVMVGAVCYDYNQQKYLKRVATDWIDWNPGGGMWGSIGGSIADQTDLQEALNAKLDVASLPDPYELPVATDVILGGVKIGSGIDITDGVISVASGGDGDVTGPETTTDNKVPQWDSTNKKLKDGLTVGTAASNLVQLDAEGKLPAVDGSNLTNVSTVASFTDLTDCPATLGTVGQVPVVNEAGDALEFATITPVYEAVSVAYTLPIPTVNGESIDIVGKGDVWVVTASGDCTIQMGFDSSVANGTLSSTSGYDSVTLVYIGGSKWVVTRPCGVLTLDAE